MKPSDRGAGEVGAQGVSGVAKPRACSRVAGLAFLGALVLAITGCAAQSIRGTLYYHVDPSQAGRRIVWPELPEVPRYLYAGELVGEHNFRRDDEEMRRGMRGVFNWLVGLFEVNQPKVTLQRPQSGVVDEGGRIYVTDVSRQAVFVFDEREGELLVWEEARGITRFLAPVGIALGADGQILVADSELKVVVRLDRTGKGLGYIGEGLLKRPTGLARDPARGILYVADTEADDIKVFDDEGRLLTVIGRGGDGDGEMNAPTYLAFGGGELYVTDTLNNRIQIFNRDGDFVRQIGRRGLFVGNFVRPKGLALDNEGNLYVVESYYDHLLIFDKTGRFLLPIGGTGGRPGKFYLPSGVWVDSRNRVFVSDMFNGRISIFQFLGGENG